MEERISDLIYFELSNKKYNSDFADNIINSKDFYLELTSKISNNDNDNTITSKIKKLIGEWEI